jgi:hypothetical protein
MFLNFMIEKMSNGDPYTISSHEEHNLCRRYLPSSILNCNRICRSDEDEKGIDEYKKRRLVFYWVFSSSVGEGLTITETLRRLIDAELLMDQQKERDLK